MKNSLYEVIQKGNIILRNNQFSLDISKQQIIDKIWNDQLKKNPSIFNGEVLSFISLKKQNNDIIVDVYFTEYKIILASRIMPELQLNIKQVGVSAITIVNDDGEKFILFSTRSKSNTEYPGYIELVPSGNIDKSILQKNNTVDYILKLKDEFFEETGMSATNIQKIQSLCLVYDKNNQIYDVGCVIELCSARNKIIDCFTKINEYESPEFVKEDSLIDYINKNRERLVPTSLAILDCFLS